MIKSLNLLQKENMGLKRQLNTQKEVEPEPNPYKDDSFHSEKESEHNLSRESINRKYLENDIETLKIEKKEIQDGYNELMVNYTNLLKKVQEYENPSKINRFTKLAEDHKPLVTKTEKKSEEIEEVEDQIEKMINLQTQESMKSSAFGGEKERTKEIEQERVQVKAVEEQSEKKISELKARIKKYEDSQKK